MTTTGKARKVKNKTTLDWVMRHIHTKHQGTDFPHYFATDRKALAKIFEKYKEMEKEYTICIVERGNQPQEAKLINLGFFHVLYEDEENTMLYVAA